jgi:Mor family transcriptional regulator
MRLNCEAEALKGIVGTDLFKRVQKELGGENIYIPKKDPTDYETIYEDFRSGLSVKDISKKHNDSRWWVGELYRQYIRESRFFTKERQ